MQPFPWTEGARRVKKTFCGGYQHGQLGSMEGFAFAGPVFDLHFHRWRQYVFFLRVVFWAWAGWFSVR